LVCWGLQAEPSSPFAAFQASFESPNAQSRYRYANAEMDAAIAEAKRAKNDSETKAALKKIAEIVTADVATIPYAAVAETIVWRQNVHGVDATSRSVAVFAKAWVDR
jgi:ABC-type transport system substrate-binding protein